MCGVSSMFVLAPMRDTPTDLSRVSRSGRARSGQMMPQETPRQPLGSPKTRRFVASGRQVWLEGAESASSNECAVGGV